MKRLLFTAAVVQLTTLVRPLVGACFYLSSRGTLARQRQAVAAAIAETVGP